MRLWSLHPRYLDRQALIACWRETLLAQKVLDGGTKGYRNHPQLQRWRATDDPLAAVGAYLWGLREEATGRGYRFDPARVLVPPQGGGAKPAPGHDEGTLGGLAGSMPVTEGQLGLEWEHLRAKVAQRSPEVHERWFCAQLTPEPHPIFHVVPGPVATWERAG